ncbi:MAG: CheR family methyltransferase, partial [Acidobacteriota bacterium]
MSDAPVAELARLIEAASGNVITPGHYPFLAQAAARRVRACSLPDLAAYVKALASGALTGEWGSLLPLITINESYFFRTPQHFAALTRDLLGSLLAARHSDRRLGIWSAGCARGEEPGTLAILLAEHPALAGWDWRILATDVDEETLAAARRGLYGARAVAQIPAPLLSRHFTSGGDRFELASALRQRIDFRTLNLMDDPLVAPGAPFDVIMLRNVLIYFRPEAQRRVARAVARNLAADGYLFLGPAETLWQISDELEPVDLGDCFCYRKKGTEDRGPGSGVRGPAPARPDDRGPGAGVRGPATARPDDRGPGSGVRGPAPTHPGDRGPGSGVRGPAPTHPGDRGPGAGVRGP